MRKLPSLKLGSIQNRLRRPRLPHLAQASTVPMALVVLLSASMGFLGGWVGSQASTENTKQSVTTSQATQVVLNESQLISELAKNVAASVVSVDVTSESVQNDFFFGGQTFEEQSAGTGFIISEDGYVVTNRHVVPNGTTSVSVTMSDGTKLDNVEVVGRTNESDPLDVAFLKIKDAKGKDLQPVKLADSSKVQVGDRVIAIGNALGQFQNTVTAGIISGYGRSIEAGTRTNSETLQNLFQTDAAINQGNSGGPLVNINGEVIGINTAVAAGSAQNIGFAIPINDVQGLIKSVLEKGQLLRPYLGIRYVTLTDDIAYQLNLNTKRGAYIAPPGRRSTPSILSGSPAEKAGLKEKDIITKVDGIPIDENNSLTSLVGRQAVGEDVTLTIVRDGKEQDIKVRLEAAPQD